MSNMGDALRKAGLISEKEAKRQRHRDRVHRKKAGRDRDGPGNRDHLVMRGRPDREVADAEAARARETVRARALREGRSGRRRWHYVDPQDRLPCLEVDEKLARLLESGDRAIAWDGASARVVDKATAQEVEGLDPAALLFWNRP